MLAVIVVVIGWCPADELSIEWSVAGVKCLVTLVELS